jgi:hypothetical protein
VAGAGVRGDRGDFGNVLTWEGENGRMAVGGMQRWPVADSRGGGALVYDRPWEGAEQDYLGERMLETTSVCSGRVPSRRIEATT